MLDAYVERQTRTIRGNQILIALRLLLATVALTVLVIHEITLIQSATRPSDLQPIFFLRAPGLVAMIVCLLTVVYSIITKFSASDSSGAPKLALVQIFVDIVLISTLIWHTGGVDSQFVVLYFFSICAAAFVLKWNVAVLAAAASTILFSTVALLYSTDHIPKSYSDQVTTAHLARLKQLSPLDFLRLLLLPVCAFFLTGILAGVLSRRFAMARLLHHEILEGIGEGIVVLDAQRSVLYHNNEFQRLLGMAAVNPGMRLEQLLGSSIDSQAADVLITRQQKRSEAQHRRGDGQILPFAVRIIPILESEEEVPRGLIISIDDITAEKKMEEFLKHRQRIETMGHISATIAHEIRNPLASIRGAVQEISRNLEIPPSKKILLEIVLSESDRLDQIITDFLRFARMRSPHLVPTDISRVLNDVQMLLSARPEAANVAMSVCGDQPRPFPADPEQLRQVFLNLGVNALQAMAGRPNPKLSFRVLSVPLHRAPGLSAEAVNDRVNRPGTLIEMSDSGPGIPDAVTRQIFEPFFTTKPTGTGLGLAVVERIVQSHEGLVTVESKLDIGTTFRVWLPSDLKTGAAISGPRPVVVA
ncbi:MAG TPA: ATP-binding protein [Planctomycetota bacterium]|nr:ATP-binding protein [Planctomycetota bacterium]